MDSRDSENELAQVQTLQFQEEWLGVATVQPCGEHLGCLLSSRVVND